MNDGLTLSMTAIARFCIGVLLVTSKPAEWLPEIIGLFPKATPTLVTVVGVSAVRPRGTCRRCGCVRDNSAFGALRSATFAVL